jgi:hypothetical protein
MSPLDEAILLVYPQRMMAGDLPYRDFFAAYGPTFWWGLEGWYTATALTVSSMRWLGLLCHVVLVLGVYQLARPEGRGQALLAAMLSALLLFPLGATPYAWLVVVALCTWQLALLRRPRSRGLVPGVLAGLAVGVRPAAALVALVPALVLLAGTARVRAWALGLALGLLPVGYDLLLTGPAFLEDVLLGRGGQGARQSMLAVPPAALDDQRLLAGLLACVLLLAVAAGRTRQRFLIAVAALAALGLPQAFQRMDTTHLLYAGLLALPYLPIALGCLLRSLPHPPRRARTFGVLGGTVLCLVTTAQIPRDLVDVMANGNRQHTTVRWQDRVVPDAPWRARALDQLLPAVAALARPGDHLFVFDADTRRPTFGDVTLYYLLPGLRQTAHHMEITPGVTNRNGSGLADDFLDADLLVLVHLPRGVPQEAFPFARPGSSEAAKVLASTFCSVQRVDRYEILRRCVPRQ